MSRNDLQGRRLRILQILAKEPCLPWTLTDAMDEDVGALMQAGFVLTYWGMGGTHWTVTDAGREALARAALTKDQGGEHGE